MASVIFEVIFLDYYPYPGCSCASLLTYKKFSSSHLHHAMDITILQCRYYGNLSFMLLRMMTVRLDAIDCDIAIPSTSWQGHQERTRDMLLL